MTQPPDPVDTFALLAARTDDPPNLRALRLAVVAMGVVLLAGFGAVIARIVYLTTRPAMTAAVSEPVRTPAGPHAIAADLTLALPPGAKIISQSVGANQLAVHYEAGGVARIVILDLETGRQVSAIVITTDSK